jgi:hypothetical protein
MDISINIQKPKRRGRKPKGGKVIAENLTSNQIIKKKQAVIVHLNCTSSDIHLLNINNNDIKYDPIIESVVSYSEVLDNNYEIISESITYDNGIKTQAKKEYHINSVNFSSSSISLIEEKLTNLKCNLETIDLCSVNSDCFWCTYPFDNSPIHIPKCYKNNKLNVYGCFCSPECALAYLMNESLDESTKFERCHLLNHTYSKIFDYTENIKPALNPHYTLEKFLGTLKIEEYRNMKNIRQFIFVDKPMTLITPEFTQDTQKIPIHKCN